jgi:predicted component of type VI protein secretion system
MSQETLRELLARVHEQLGASGGAIDPESRQLLTTVMRDIERVLAQSPRLESLAVRFESAHPGLAETLRELIDALTKAGI